MSLGNISVPLLRWTLGLAVIMESCEFIVFTSAAHFMAKTGLSFWLRPTLGGVEIIAAVLFLIPYTAKFGSYVLLTIFGLAALFHLLHGQFHVEGLVVYAAAVLVCLEYENKSSARASQNQR